MLEEILLLQMPGSLHNNMLYNLVLNLIAIQPLIVIFLNKRLEFTAHE